MSNQQDGCALTVHRVNDHVEIRNAQLGADSPVLSVSTDEWGDFLINVQDGIEPAGVLRTRQVDEDTIVMWHTESSDAPLEFPANVWKDFVERAKHEEYDLGRLPRRTAEAPA
ncbi:hypothetical protein [Nonomuraea jabiensis]|uniref:hypothetical protein n=1 Tax=Nonomuraea jabiensis TaxID=882448 RepID=UPI003D7245D1